MDENVIAVLLHKHFNHHSSNNHKYLEVGYIHWHLVEGNWTGNLGDYDKGRCSTLFLFIYVKHKF